MINMQRDLVRDLERVGLGELVHPRKPHDHGSRDRSDLRSDLDSKR
jgi:hypothetical protein